MKKPSSTSIVSGVEKVYNASVKKRLLLLSIRPRYGNLILSGEKRFELRRTSPNVQPGQWVLLYFSAPQMRLAGAFEIAEVLRQSPSEVWPRVKGVCGLSRREFEDYFDGAEQACALRVSRVIRFHRAQSLESLRRKWPGFRPPQAFRYVPSSNPIVPKAMGQHL